MKKRKTHPRVGSRFEDFLRDEGRLEEATAIAIKRVLACEALVAKARARAGLTEAEALRLAVAETRSARGR